MKNKLTTVKFKDYIKTLFRGCDVYRSSDSEFALYTKHNRSFVCTIKEKTIYLLSMICGAIALILALITMSLIVDKTMYFKIVLAIGLVLLNTAFSIVLLRCLYLAIYIRYYSSSQEERGNALELSSEEPPKLNNSVHERLGMGASMMFCILVLIS